MWILERRNCPSNVLMVTEAEPIKQLEQVRVHVGHQHQRTLRAEHLTTSLA